MARYNDDRNFTDYVHKNVSIPNIYPLMYWQVSEIDADELNKLDINNGIDAIILDNNSNKRTLQYRYRESDFERYTDVTLRYRRPHNSNKDRHDSEFFKIDADYLLYGISNGKKSSDKLRTNTAFLKWAILDLRQLFTLIDEGLIVIDPSQRYKCARYENKLICPVNNNRDKSSNFVPFDIPILKDLFGNRVVVQSSGF